MFSDDCEYDNLNYDDVVECEKHTGLNLQMAHESMVLLKNDGILPLKGTEKIAVIGPNADDILVLLGNYNGRPSEYITLLKGIQEEAKNKVYYALGCHVYKEQFSDYDEKPGDEAYIVAQKADVIIMCMGLNPTMEGEEGDAFNGDMSGDKKDLNLPSSQQHLYDKIISLGKPVIFVNVSGSAMNLCRQDEECSAVIQCFYPGAVGGKAFSDIIFGKTSPSGRLPVTFYRSVDDLPPFIDYSMENRTYKFFKGKPLYEFGYGLTYSEISEDWLDENTVKITNKGDFDTMYSVLKYEYIPHKSLCGFKKIFIKAGECTTLNF